MNTKNSQIIAGIVVVIVIIGVWWFAMRNRAASPAVGSASSASQTATTSLATTVSAASESSSVTPTTAASGESVKVADQEAGPHVALDMVAVSKPTWIAVKDANGWILGAARFNANVATGTIPLLRATTAGQTYSVVMYVDDGDLAFDFHKDMLAVDTNENPVSVSFKTQ